MAVLATAGQDFNLFKLHDLRSRPAFDVEVVGDHARARPESSLEDRADLLVEPGEHVKRNYGCRGNVGGQGILLPKLHQVAHPFFRRLFSRELDQLRIDFEPHTSGAEFFCRPDHDPSVAATQIVNDIILRDPGELEHPVRHLHRRGDEGDFIPEPLWGGVACGDEYPTPGNEDSEAPKVLHLYHR